MNRQPPDIQTAILMLMLLVSIGSAVIAAVDLFRCGALVCMQ